jgi:hypothetical protein
VSYDSEPHHPPEVGSGVATCLTAPCGLRALNIKKRLAVLTVQLGTHIPNALAQVSKAPDRACMTCEQTTQSMPARHADRKLQCNCSTALALSTTLLALLQCQATQQHNATLLTECSVAGNKIRCANAAEDIICYS